MRDTQGPAESLICRYREETTIFLTTHYMDEADTLSNRINIMDHGEIIASGTAEELKNSLGQDMIYLDSANNERGEGLVSGMEGVQGVMTLLTMPIFFSSNALYSTAMLPSWLNAISKINPLTYLVNGVRYFAVGSDFYAMGTHYAYTTNDVLFSLAFLLAFAGVTYLMAWLTFKKAVVT